MATPRAERHARPSRYVLVFSDALVHYRSWRDDIRIKSTLLAIYSRFFKINSNYLTLIDISTRTYFSLQHSGNYLV